MCTVSRSHARPEATRLSLPQDVLSFIEAVSHGVYSGYRGPWAGMQVYRGPEAGMQVYGPSLGHSL